jgi:GNAT superfamily N-acetyltransferase
MTDREYDRENKAFDELSIEHNNPIEKDERHGFVALDNDLFIGCSSGLAYKSEMGYNPYFYLTDLFVEKEYRRKGIGAKLLHQLEEEITKLGILYIWTWTAEYEGAAFYERQGYLSFAKMEQWYVSGHSRIGFVKKLPVKDK